MTDKVKSEAEVMEFLRRVMFNEPPKPPEVLKIEDMITRCGYV